MWPISTAYKTKSNYYSYFCVIIPMEVKDHLNMIRFHHSIFSVEVKLFRSSSPELELILKNKSTHVHITLARSPRVHNTS